LLIIKEIESEVVSFSVYCLMTKIWKKSKLKSEKIWEIQKKGKLNSEKIWKTLKKRRLNSKMIWKK
jgi:hypothetical protein